MNYKTWFNKSTKNVDIPQEQDTPREDDKLAKTFEEISKLKTRYQSIYDELPDLLCTIDTNENILDCNKSYAETFGYSKNEVIGKTIFDFLAQEESKDCNGSFKTWKQTVQFKNKKVSFKKKDGSKFSSLVIINNLYDEGGKTIGNVIIIKDITGIYAAQEDVAKSQPSQSNQLKSGTLLAKAEKKYSTMYDKTPALLRTITTEGIITDCNRTYAKALGYTKEECIGKSVYEHTAARSVQDIKLNTENWLKTHETAHCETWMKRKDGSIFPTALNGTSLYDEQGKLTGRMMIMINMSEIYESKLRVEESQKQLQDQVKRLEKLNVRISLTQQKYKNLYEKSPAMLRSITIEGLLTDCNEAYARSLGYTKEECLGKSMFEHTAEQSISALKENLENWKNTSEVGQKEMWMKRKDDTIFPVLLTGNTLYDEYSNVIGRTVALTDMTEIYDARKQLHEDEVRLREQYENLKQSHDLITTTQQKYKNLYEKSPAMLRSITMEGFLTDCNEEYARALGYTKEECIGKSMFEHTAERSVNALKENLENWKDTRDVGHSEIWMRRKDNSIFPAMLTGDTITDAHGNVVGRTVALTDMTEIYDTRKKLEDKETKIRQQYEELKKLDVAKEEFTSMISHELKTPLTPIIGWCQALKNPKIIGEMSPKQIQAVEAIQSNALKLKDLVSDMLDTHKLDMKQMKFDHKYIDVSEMMGFLTKNLHSVMEPKHIEFVNSTTESLVLKSDRSRLEQVLNNIILNAVDFVPEKGRIEVKAETKDDKVQFMIKDNGMGIPKNKQSNLFKQFYQLDTSATRKHGGSGLGLAICKGIVEALGGHVWVDSDTGMGATFYFTIPIEANVATPTIEEKIPVSNS